VIWLLANWRVALGGALIALLAVTATTYRIERDRARADASAAHHEIDVLNAAGRMQDHVTDQKDAESAEITRRATDALIAYRLDADGRARDRADRDARRLLELAAARSSCSLPGLPGSASGASGAVSASGGPAGPLGRITAYTAACDELDAKYAAWQSWYLKQRADFH
jgi:hypothetical protein